MAQGHIIRISNGNWFGYDTGVALIVDVILDMRLPFEIRIEQKINLLVIILYITHRWPHKFV